MSANPTGKKATRAAAWTGRNRRQRPDYQEQVFKILDSKRNADESIIRSGARMRPG